MNANVKILKKDIKPGGNSDINTESSDYSTRISKPFFRLLNQNKSIPTLFCELVNKLSKWFSISNGNLVLHHYPTGILKLASWWDLYCFKQGILMELPAKNSIYYKVLKSKEIYHEQITGKFPGNHIEKKIIANSDSASICVYPLIYDDITAGLISFSSPIPFAFEMLEKGYLSSVFEDFAKIIVERSSQEFWLVNFEKG